ncbi:D-glycerate dehydrogenase [Candidatus Woesebacteria bacterium]|nr:D-glycerate dehydrogenase [Candidatus Woesebacteria bacterium]
MKIFVTRQIPGDHIDKLKQQGHDVVVSEFDRPLTSEELVVKVKGLDGLLCLLTDKIDGDLMDAAGPGLKIISNYAVGFDNIDIEAANKRGILITNTPSEEVNEAVAEHTWALILALTRRLFEASESVKKGAYSGWEPDIFLGSSLSGKTLGVVGLGRIGTLVAKRAQGFNVNVLYNKHAPDPEAEKEFNVKFANLDELLSKSDFVSIHVPLTEETRHMFNSQTLAKMKQGSYLINTARGPIVDEHALAESLMEGHLRGAGLDVFDNEPNINPELINMPNVILTPHIASATWEARNKMGEQAVQAIIDTLADQKPENLVDDKIWNNRRK